MESSLPLDAHRPCVRRAAVAVAAAGADNQSHCHLEPLIHRCRWTADVRACGERCGLVAAAAF